MLRCDPRKRQIRIVDMARELDSASAFSLAALDNKTKALALVNAGSTASFNFSLSCRVATYKWKGSKQTELPSPSTWSLMHIKSTVINT